MQKVRSVVSHAIHRSGLGFESTRLDKVDHQSFHNGLLNQFVEFQHRDSSLCFIEGLKRFLRTDCSVGCTSINEVLVCESDKNVLELFYLFVGKATVVKG